jgi:hypothetical protein
MTALFGAIGFLKDFVRLVLDLVEARVPFRIETSVGGCPAAPIITLTNQTKDMPLHVHKVRIHFGMRNYSWAFVLPPHGSHYIAPRNKLNYAISYEASQTCIQRRYLTPKTLRQDDTSVPEFGPADLFKAIANGKPRDSWLEIDFNEFADRRYRRGRVKWMFRHTIDIGPPPTEK